MWNCLECGCSCIAASLTFCPMCFKERDMPKITKGGGATNGWEENYPAVVVEPEPVVEPAVVPPAPVPAPEPVPVPEPVPAPSPGPEPAPVVVD